MSIYINEKGLVPVSFHKPKKKKDQIESFPELWKSLNPGKDVEVTFPDGTKHTVKLTEVSWQSSVDFGMHASFSGLLKDKPGATVQGHSNLLSQDLVADTVHHKAPYSWQIDGEGEYLPGLQEVSGELELSIDEGQSETLKAALYGEPEPAPDADLSQIAADLEKLPALKKPSYGNAYLESAMSSSALVSKEMEKALFGTYKKAYSIGFDKNALSDMYKNSWFLSEQGVQPPHDPVKALEEYLIKVVKEISAGIQAGKYQFGDKKALTAGAAIPPKGGFIHSFTSDPINDEPNTIKHLSLKLEEY